MDTPSGAVEVSLLDDGEDVRPPARAPPRRHGPSLGFGLRWLAATCVVPALYVAYVWHYGANSFFWDDWSRIPLLDAARHGGLTLNLLWTQSNESRLLIPNLFWVFFQLTAHSDTKTIMLFDACLFIASYAFLLVIYRRTVDRRIDPLQIVAIGLVWFSLADWENALWAFQIAWYLIIFFLMAMLLALSRRELTPGALAVAMAFAAAASFSSLQGLFAWPVGLLCILWRLDDRSRKITYAAPWVAAGAVTAGVYFWHFSFQNAYQGSAIGFPLRNPVKAAEYLLAAVGNAVPTVGASSVAVHALVGIPFCLAAGWVLIASWHDRMRTTGSHPLPLPAALIVFALLFDISIDLGRVGSGVAGALGSRYTMANLLLILGIILFALQRLTTWRDAPESTSSPLPVAGTWVLIVLLGAQFLSSANYGVVDAGLVHNERIVGARIATNLPAIPIAARRPLVSQYLYPPLYPGLQTYFTIARHDELGAFAPGSYEHYRALGPPARLVRQTLAAFSRSRTVWCQASLGETLTQITAQMGQPSGTDFAFWAAVLGKHFHTTIPYAEWDVGDDVLVALFEKGQVSSLLAYSGTISNPSKDLHCPATRR